VLYQPTFSTPVYLVWVKFIKLIKVVLKAANNYCTSFAKFLREWVLVFSGKGTSIAEMGCGDFCTQPQS
jgi:hypothetical protein